MLLFRRGLARLDDGLTDLVNLAVFDTGGREIGHVRAVLNHGASDLLEVHAPGRRASILIPFTRDIVPTVDLTAGRVIVDPPEGLLDEGGA